MNSALIERQFGAIGARVKVGEPRRQLTDRSFLIDVRRDEEGEYFDIQAKKEIDLMILDTQKKNRHLLLLTRDAGNKDNPKSRFLCGHDERHWFTCAIPEKLAVSSVVQAKQALKPRELQDLESREGLKTKLAHKRHRKLRSGRKVHRQGEFMFIPYPDFQPPASSTTVVHKNEPMRGGGHKFHYAQFLYRTGGSKVYVHPAHARNGLSELAHTELIMRDPLAKRGRWSIMYRDPIVYVKGKITHADHETCNLGDTWHKVMLSTEATAKAARNVAFLD